MFRLRQILCKNVCNHIPGWAVSQSHIVIPFDLSYMVEPYIDIQYERFTR